MLVHNYTNGLLCGQHGGGLVLGRLQACMCCG